MNRAWGQGIDELEGDLNVSVNMVDRGGFNRPVFGLVDERGSDSGSGREIDTGRGCDDSVIDVAGIVNLVLAA
ncbi:hypothetical protein [Ferrimonas pelagia]|uniref:Uncharacterized protein n=1 Tax=Ferrimonas pelagia TaxID=1177826 RepID=A0ABP9EXB1_9GAMM